VERLQDISEADALAEGCDPSAAARLANPSPYKNAYRILWESINGEGSWAKNPWVYVVEFQKLNN
jgi:hypothetical protein